jgi:hypothetical protein
MNANIDGKSLVSVPRAIDPLSIRRCLPSIKARTRTIDLLKSGILVEEHCWLEWQERKKERRGGGGNRKELEKKVK